MEVDGNLCIAVHARVWYVYVYMCRMFITQECTEHLLFFAHIRATHTDCHFEKFKSTCILHYEVMILFIYTVQSNLLQEDLKKTEKILLEDRFYGRCNSPQPPTSLNFNLHYCMEEIDVNTVKSYIHALSMR